MQTHITHFKTLDNGRFSQAWNEIELLGTMTKIVSLWQPRLGDNIISTIYYQYPLYRKSLISEVQINFPK